MGLLVTVKSYVSDFRHGNECLESVHHADAGAENRDNGELAARYLLGCHLTDRGLYLDVVKRKIPGDLVSHQKGNLFKQFAEILGTGFLFPHNRQLMLDHGMVNNVHCAHWVKFFVKLPYFFHTCTVPGQVIHCLSHEPEHNNIPEKDYLCTRLV